MNFVELYTKDKSTLCNTTKNMLMAKQIPFIEYRLGVDYTQQILLEKFPEASTFPVVVVDGFHIGSFNELRQKLHEETQTTKKLLLEGK